MKHITHKLIIILFMLMMAGGASAQKGFFGSISRSKGVGKSHPDSWPSNTVVSTLRWTNSSPIPSKLFSGGIREMLGQNVGIREVYGKGR